MAEDATLREHEEALASERKDRAVAVLGLPELIAGIQVEPLTPRRLEWLRAMGNPFICGGEASIPAVTQFLWIISKGFVICDDVKRDAFLASIIVGYDLVEIREGIEAYLDRAYLDAPEGPNDGPSFFAPSIGIYRAINKAYGDEWTFERVMETPLRILFQLTKCDDKASGCSVINRRSYKVQGKWLSELETLTADTEDSVVELMTAKRAEGYKQVTLAQKSSNGTWSLAMRKGVIENGE